MADPTIRPSHPVITRAEDRPPESWNDPVRGSVTWATLFSSDITPTDSLCAGVAVLKPGGGSLVQHRHAEPEIYYILEGTGILTIEDRETVVTAGAAVFIPGDAAHGLRNESAAIVRLFYVFPTSCFADVTYRFPDPPAPPR